MIKRNKVNKKENALGVNVVMNMILTMSSLIFSFITFPYVSRILQAEGLGRIQLATSYIAYFALVAQLGIPTYGITACAAVRENRRKLTKTVHELLLIQCITTVITYVVLFLSIWIVPQLAEDKKLYLIMSASILLNMLGVEWLFKALEQYGYITIRSIALKVVSIIAMFCFVREENDYLIYAGISVLAASGSALLNLTQLHRYIDFRPLSNYHFRQHLRPVFLLFANTCATTVYCSLDSVMLGFMISEEEVGYYSVAIKVKTILVSVVTAIGAVLLPRMSYSYNHGDKKTYWDLAEKSLGIVVRLAIPLTVFFIIFAEDSILFLLGEGYKASVLPMQIIMPTLLFIGITYVTGLQILVPIGKSGVVLKSSIVGAVVDALFNVLLIPSMGSAGAAIGTLVAEIAVLIVQVREIKEDLTPLFKKVRFLSVALAAIIAALSSILIKYLILSEFWILALGACTFFGVYLFVLYLLKDPIIKALLSRLNCMVQRVPE